MSSNRGQLYVIAAPSGAGKTTLVHKLMASDDSLCFSVSYTTRPKRHTETDGEDYFFVDEKTFQAMIAAGDFMEHALVFDNRYGTSKFRVESLLNEGRNVILEIDWQGAKLVRNHMPECHSIFILPPSVDALQQRLNSRGTDSPEVIARRFQDAVGDMSHWHEFDYVVINDDLDQALSELAAIIRGNGAANSASEPMLRARINGILDCDSATD
jgi:guanylate kinase